MLHYHCCVANSQLFFVLLRKFVFPKCITLKSRLFIFCHAQLFSSIHFLNEFIQKDIICIKFIYSEKAAKFCKIFPLLLIVCTVVKSKGRISQNVVAFPEYMNFMQIFHRVMQMDNIGWEPFEIPTIPKIGNGSMGKQ